MNPIFIGLSSIKKRDSSRFRQHLFSKLLLEKPFLRIAHQAFLKSEIRPLISFLLILYSLRRFFQIRIHLEKDRKEIAVFNYGNERRAIERVSPLENSISYGAFKLPMLPSFSMKKTLIWIRVSMKLLKKNGFLVGARQAEFLVLYGFYRNFFSRENISGQTFLSASEANPEVIAAVLAAKRTGNKTVFINHSALESEQGIFFHDEIMLSASAYAGRIQGTPRIKILDFLAKSRSLNLPNFERIKRIGIACSVVTSPELIRKTVESCLETFPNAEVVIRQHPNPTFSPVKESWLPKNPRVTVSSRKGQGPMSDLLDWDFAIAGSSSVHLDLLELGIPTVHQNIEGIDWDLYDFVGSGLVPSVNKAHEIPASMNAVYSQERWEEIFGRYCGKH
jgi:hypothetical protein